MNFQRWDCLLHNFSNTGSKMLCNYNTVQRNLSIMVAVVLAFLWAIGGCFVLWSPSH